MNTSDAVVRFYSGQRLHRRVLGQPATVRVERICYTMWFDTTYNDTVEFSDGTWLSYTPGYGWRYFCPTGPLLGQPVLLDETGFLQPSYWRKFVEQLATPKASTTAPRRLATTIFCFILRFVHAVHPLR